MRGVFVTGTDTGAGKTMLAGALVHSLRAGGVDVAACKPVITGLEEPGPHDDELLGAVTLARFGPAVSPHLAAELAGEALDPSALAAGVREALAGAQAGVVEGAGGLLVPLAGAYTMRDLARDVGLPVVVAARPGLGTINHCLLTVEAARAAGLDVRAVVMGPWPSDPSVLELSNRETVARLAGVDVAVLAHVAAEPAALAAAGADLPVEEWLGEARPGP